MIKIAILNIITLISVYADPKSDFDELYKICKNLIDVKRLALGIETSTFYSDREIRRKLKEYRIKMINATRKINSNDKGVSNYMTSYIKTTDGVKLLLSFNYLKGIGQVKRNAIVKEYYTFRRNNSEAFDIVNKIEKRKSNNLFPIVSGNEIIWVKNINEIYDINIINYIETGKNATDLSKKP